MHLQLSQRALFIALAVHYVWWQLVKYNTEEGLKDDVAYLL